MATNNNTLNQISVGVAKALLPLDTYFTDLESFTIFMRSLGWEVTEIPPPITALNTGLNQVYTKLGRINRGNVELSDFIALIDSVQTVTKSVYDLKNSSFNPSLTAANFQNVFPKQLLDYLLISYINDNAPSISSILEFLGIIRHTTIKKSLLRPTYMLKEIDWNNLKHLFSSPEQILENVYGWKTSNFKYEQLFFSIYKILQQLGLYLIAEPINKDILSNLTAIENDNFVEEYSTFNYYLFSYSTNNIKTDGKFQLFYLPSKNGSLPGIGLIPVVQSQLSKDIEIGTNRFLSINSTLDINGGIALLKRPNESFAVKTGFENGSPSNITGQFSVSLVNKNTSPKIVLGDEDGSRIEYGSIDMNLIFELNAQQKNEIRFEVPINNLKFILDTSKGDSFINKVVPNGGFTLSMDLVLGYSTIRGFYFLGSGGLEYKLPMHRTIGPLTVDNMIVSLGYKDNFLVNFTTDLTLSLGVVTATIRNIGMSGEMSIGNHGGLGGVDFSLGFKPPTGVGLAIDAPPVKGGGFLNYDEATSTYTGGLELKFSKISFAAIGIISTKLPGGESGYSLLIIISVEFTPLQLGMGFTLNGIGGLMGLHRTSNPDFLRSGIRYNTLDHILFPKNIVQNSNAIISNLGQAFPIRKDQFVMGPMAKIGWGTPSLITLDLGIVIELPDPLRLLILGILRAQLPSENNAILRLQVNFLGIIDFKEKYLSFDASLYDSKIVGFSLYGDMALRMNWGNRPNFLLSVGGFHPSYTPPPLNLPSMQRLTVVLADSKNLKISVETYFAVTSNSAQFGASVYAMAKAWKIKAIGQLWFNVLFQFSPFYFNADMGVKFAIMMGRRTIMGLYISLQLEGPDPWRAQGYGSFKILFVRVRIRLNSTFGRQRVEAIESVFVDDKIKAALALADNWESILPERNHQLVSWRKQAANEELSVDPAGAIKISQRLMPLNTVMQKFSSANIADFNRYSINSIKIDNTQLPIEHVKDYFARNEFSHMKDEDKLSRDGYELFNSGVTVGSGNTLSAQYAVHKRCEYEEISLDAGHRRYELSKYILLAKRMKVEAIMDYTTRTSLSRVALTTISKGPSQVKLSVKEGEFVLANRNNLTQVSSNLSFTNTVDAEQYLEEQRRISPDSVRDWIIANRYELID